MKTSEEVHHEIEAGRASQRYILAGIPKKYHDVKADAPLLDAIARELPATSFVCLLADTVEAAVRVASVLTKRAVDLRRSASMVGLRAMNSVYKTSFRNPELTMTLRDKVKNPTLLVITNIDESSLAVWRDCRDLAWLQATIQSRTNAGKATVFCADCGFTPKKMEFLLGKMNAETMRGMGVKKVRWRAEQGGEIRLTIHHENSKRAK